MLKRYLVFAYSDYRSCGGWSDFYYDYDSIEELQKDLGIGILSSTIEVVDTLTRKSEQYSYAYQISEKDFN